MNEFQAWQLLLITLMGGINGQLQDLMVYLQEENRGLKNKLTGKRIRFTYDQRRLLTVKGKVLAWKDLPEVASRSGTIARRAAVDHVRFARIRRR